MTETTTKRDRAALIARLTYIAPELDDEGLEALVEGGEALLLTHRRTLDEGTLAAEQATREAWTHPLERAPRRTCGTEDGSGPPCPVEPTWMQAQIDRSAPHAAEVPVFAWTEPVSRPVPGEIADAEHSGERGPRDPMAWAAQNKVTVRS